MVLACAYIAQITRHMKKKLVISERGDRLGDAGKYHNAGSADETDQLNHETVC